MDMDIDMYTYTFTYIYAYVFLNTYTYEYIYTYKYIMWRHSPPTTWIKLVLPANCSESRMRCLALVTI